MWTSRHLNFPGFWTLKSKIWFGIKICSKINSYNKISSRISVPENSRKFREFVFNLATYKTKSIPNWSFSIRFLEKSSAKKHSCHKFLSNQLFIFWMFDFQTLSAKIPLTKFQYVAYKTIIWLFNMNFFIKVKLFYQRFKMDSMYHWFCVKCNLKTQNWNVK